MRIALKGADYSNNYISKDINYDYPNDEWQDDKSFNQLAPSNVDNASLVGQPVTKAEANNNKFAALIIRLKKGDKVHIENGHAQTSNTSLYGMYDANTLELIFASEVKAATIAQEVEHTVEYDDVYFVISALVKFQGDTTYAPKVTVTKYKYVNKCFITKLQSSVDNDNLPVLGQLRINWLKQSDLTDNDARAIGLSTNDSITIKVSGAHLTDNTLSSNIGNSKTITKDNGLVWLYVSNNADAILTIDNKYSLTILSFVKSGKDSLVRSVKFDIDDIRYCTALTDLRLSNTQVSGDINAVSQLTALTSLGLNNTNVSGMVDSLTNLTKLGNLNDLKGLSLTGDMSKIPTTVYVLSQDSRKVNTNFTWTAKGRQNATFLAMGGFIPFDTASMDNMLIDQATCTFKGSDTAPWTKMLQVSGTRTSASDAAVAAIQNMGVTITGVTKQA